MICQMSPPDVTITPSRIMGVMMTTAWTTAIMMAALPISLKYILPASAHSSLSRNATGMEQNPVSTLASANLARITASPAKDTIIDITQKKRAPR